MKKIIFLVVLFFSYLPLQGMQDSSNLLNEIHQQISQLKSCGRNIEDLFVLLREYKESGGDPDEIYDKQTLLTNAIRLSYNYDLVKFLVEKIGVDINKEGIHSLTPLMQASIIYENTLEELEGKVAILKFLLKNGALVNYQNKSNFTALHLGCNNGSLKIIEILLEQNANYQLKDKLGLTPGHYVSLKMLPVYCKLTNTNILDYLYYSLYFSTRDDCHDSLKKKILGGYLDESLSYIDQIEAGADFNVKDEGGNTLWSRFLDSLLKSRLLFKL